MNKFITTTLVLGTLAAGIQTALANTNTNDSNTAVTTINQTTQIQKTWLGVSLAPMPQVLSKQLGDLIPENQGVMIQSVSPNSPAAKAGLQAYDILLSLNDQKLYSAQQLAGLIASNKADDEVTFKLVRNGKSEVQQVKLDARSVALSPMSRAPAYGFNNGFGSGFGQGFNSPFFSRPFAAPVLPQGTTPLQPNGKGKVNVMQQFESISINKTGDGKVRAEVTIDNNGDKKEFNFEGKYDEVRKQIRETKELPEDKKNSLLNALDNKPSQLFSNGFSNFPQFPAFPRMPAFNGFLSDPFYNQPNRLPSWYKNNSKL